MAPEQHHDPMIIAEGDIFRWRYKGDAPDDLGPYGRYHCKSRIAVARDGVLHDTYWGISSSETVWTYAYAAGHLVLTRVGNFAGLEKKSEYYAAYYADADCVDLNHSNSTRGNFYIRKGAQRSADKMRAEIAQRRKQAVADAGSAQRRVDELDKASAETVAGAPLGSIHII